ncbi:MAG: ABC transporter substrate-binding protein [Rhodospirillaceae bacterium]|nr:ABC transporter substrate-binding protein [Rhodospirillaceae bacterium]
MPKWMPVVVVVAALAGLAWWLSDGPRDAAAPSTAAVATPAPTTKSAPKTLRVGLVALPPERGYPYNSTGLPTIYTYRAIFDGLTFVTNDGEVLPYLATAWKQVDPLTWRFTLRENVTFSNGKPFTADAVVFAVEHLRSPEASTDAIARELVGVQSAVAESPTSVLLKTSRAEPLLPAALEQLLIVEPEHFKAVGKEGFAAAPIGTGPFMVKTWSNAKIELDAFKGSWRAPKVDALELIAVPETSARVQGILSDQIDLAVAMGREDVLALDAGGAAFTVTPSNSVLAVTFILSKLPPGHPLLDKRVRQALNYAVNKQAYIDALFGGLTQAASQPTTKSGFGYDPTIAPYPYDPEKAKALLAEAGHPKGFEFTVELTPAGGTALSETYQQVASDLAKVGVNMIIRAITVPQLVRGVQTGEWSGQAFNMNFSAERTTDALRPVRLHSCLGMAPWYCDKGVTAKIEQAYATADLDARRALTQEIMRHYHDEAPVIWLHEVVLFEGMSKRVRGYRNDHTVISYQNIELVD